MLRIIVKPGEHIDKALKRYKRKFNETKVIPELRERSKFTKKSTLRREEIKKAKYIQHLRDEEDKD